MPDQTRNLNSVTDFAGTLDSNDRIIMTDNKASLKALTTAILGKAMIEGYTGSSLAGSSQSVKSAIDSLNSNFIYASSLDDLCTKILAMPTSRTAPLFTTSTTTSALINVYFIGKGYVSKVSNTVADILIYAGSNGELYAVRVNPTTKEISTGNVISLPTRAEMDDQKSKNYTDQANGNSLLDFVATLAKGTYNFRLDNAPEAPVTGGITYTVIKTHNVGDARCSITALPMDTSSPDIYTAFIGQNATSITWQKQPTRAEVDTLNSNMQQKIIRTVVNIGDVTIGNNGYADISSAFEGISNILFVIPLTWSTMDNISPFTVVGDGHYVLSTPNNVIRGLKVYVYST